MVFSKVSNIEYVETDNINDNDKEMECNTYDVLFENIDTKYHTIVFGNCVYDNQSKGYVHFPIYLVNNDKVVKQIGVFECQQEKLTMILDEDGDIDPEYFTKPILYEFVNKPFLEKHETKTEDVVVDESPNGELDEKELDIEELEDDDVFRVKESTHVAKPKTSVLDTIFDHDHKKPLPNLLDEETKLDAQEIKSKFKVSTSNSWIQKFMKSNYYNIIDNEGGGDCLFAVIRDAFAQVGKNTTVRKLRALVADEATDDIFEEYRKVYLEMTNELDEIEKRIKSNETAMREYKKRATTVTSKKDHAEIIARAKSTKEEITKATKEKRSQESFINENFSFMKTITSLDKFKEYIKTSHFWADIWAISMLEYKLNFKFIILSEESYLEDAHDSVLNCGDSNPHIAKLGVFRPDYYIMTCYTGNHYKTITYKEKKLFTFREIPYDIKSLVINKCMERNSGVFYLIEEFKNIKEDMGLMDTNEGEEERDTSYDFKLFDPSIRFVIHSKSQNKPYPGKGSGEKISKSDMHKFKELAAIDNWRRKLDDSYIGEPLEIDNKKWASVTHYYQGSKYKKTYPQHYYKFSLDSGTKLSKDVKMAKETGSMKGQPKEVSIDPDFYGDRNVQEKEIALKAKFENESMKNILLLTQNAEIALFSRGSPAEPAIELMTVRKFFQQK